MRRIQFTKMHGAGNDFVMLNGVTTPIHLSTAQLRWLADRRFGIGADQILLVEPSQEEGVDFSYRIFNADGVEVEHCGNGARCFVRFVNEQGLSHQSEITVRTRGGLLTLSRIDRDRVKVNMGSPRFALADIPFRPLALARHRVHHCELWIVDHTMLGLHSPGAVELGLVSMGNPHAVVLVERTSDAPVQILGPAIQALEHFPAGVNVGFMQILSRDEIALRVYERGSGETLACGSGACAAVVNGILRGLLDSKVKVRTRGGVLEVEWAAVITATISPCESQDWPIVELTGPTQTVFTGEIDIPDSTHFSNEHALP